MASVAFSTPAKKVTATPSKKPKTPGTPRNRHPWFQKNLYDRCQIKNGREVVGVTTFGEQLLATATTEEALELLPPLPSDISKDEFIEKWKSRKNYLKQYNKRSKQFRIAVEERKKEEAKAAAEKAKMVTSAAERKHEKDMREKEQKHEKEMRASEQKHKREMGKMVIDALDRNNEREIEHDAKTLKEEEETARQREQAATKRTEERRIKADKRVEQSNQTMKAYFVPTVTEAAAAAPTGAGLDADVVPTGSGTGLDADVVAPAGTGTGLDTAVVIAPTGKGLDAAVIAPTGTGTGLDTAVDTAVVIAPTGKGLDAVAKDTPTAGCNCKFICGLVVGVVLVAIISACFAIACVAYANCLHSTGAVGLPAGVRAVHGPGDAIEVFVPADAMANVVPAELPSDTMPATKEDPKFPASTECRAALFSIFTLAFMETIEPFIDTKTISDYTKTISDSTERLSNWLYTVFASVKEKTESSIDTITTPRIDSTAVSTAGAAITHDPGPAIEGTRSHRGTEDPEKDAQKVEDKELKASEHSDKRGPSGF